MNLFMFLPDDGGCGYYRAALPVEKCAPDLERNGVQVSIDSKFSLSANYDAMIFHRIVNPAFLPRLWTMINKEKKTIIWELDDNLFEIPEKNMASRSIGLPEKECLALCLEWCHKIIVSTDILKEQICSYGMDSEKIFVLPNLIDTNDVRFTRERDGRNLRVLWAGSQTHTGDLEIITPAILHLMKSHSYIDFIFMGYCDPNLATASKLHNNGVNFTFLPPCEMRYYYKALKMIDPDIALLPLEENLFNEAKSAIKFYEMTMAGAACIASPVGPYTVIGGDSTFDDCGILLDNNREQSWIDAIEYLYNEESKVESCHQSAVYFIERECSWQTQSHIWTDFFLGLKNDVYERQRVSVPVLFSPQEEVRS